MSQSHPNRLLRTPDTLKTIVRSLCVTGIVISCIAYGLGQSTAAGAAKRHQPESTLVATPGRVLLQGAYAEVRVLVDSVRPNAFPADVSEVAVYTVANSRVATVDIDGIVHPVADGKTILTIKLKQAEVAVPVDVNGIAVHGTAMGGAPHFVNDVIPVLTRAGCNQGSCHGAAAGKGGFKLSLQGYDPEADYFAITRAADARRVARSQPDNSLLLRKPTMEVAHKGGLRFAVGSPDYRLIRDWIARGMPGPDPKDPRVTKLDVSPRVRTLSVGQSQRYIVTAHFSDGTLRDATAQTLFNSSDETVASVTGTGEAKVNGAGEGAVVIRYQGLVATARVISPYAKPRVQSAGSNSSAAANVGPSAADGSATIDRLASAKLGALGLSGSPRCSDGDFLRRSYLDTIGILPTADEARDFLQDRDPHKRDRLIDTLLNRPEYVDYWTLAWGDLLRCSRSLLTEKGMYALNGWIRQSVQADKPWDTMVREVVLAQGSSYSNGPANFYRAANTPQDRAETTAQAFLGVRIQCAKCHNHPYDKWTQNQYYQFAAFFARVSSKDGDRKDEKIIYASDKGEVTHPKSGKTMVPCALDSTPLGTDYTDDRRRALADWLTSPQNPFFTHEIVNRIWKHFMGRGLVEPVDDLRATNPPSNEALFDWLAADLVSHHYDLKYLMRTILGSQTYQRSSDTVNGNDRDTHYYSHFAFKRLGAEQLMDALSAATGVSDKFDGYPTGMRAVQLPDTSANSYFLDLFGRPARSITCACERDEQPSLSQVLHLMNSTGMNAQITAKTGRIAELMQSKLPDAKRIEALYLTAFSRYPTTNESRKAVMYLGAAKDKQAAMEDFFWVLLNSKEFVFNH